MKIKKINVRKLFYNNKFVVVFSILLAFLLWIKFSSSSAESTSKTISNIPINVALSESAQQDGLVVFGLENVTAEVSVSGSRLVLGQLTKDNIQVFAQQSAGLINTTGNYTLELSAKKTGIFTDYEITSSVAPRFINVFVDHYKTKSFEIAPEIKYKSDPKYFSSPVSLSESSITISGPDSIVSAIAKVCVESELKDTLSKTTTIYDLPISLYDENGKKISYSMLDMSFVKVDATIALLSRKTFKVVPTFNNKPDGLSIYSNQINVSPAYVEIAATEEMLSSIDKIELESIDFTKIKAISNDFNLALKVPSGCRSLNNIYSAKLKLDMSDMATKRLSVKQFDFLNLSEGKTASCTTSSITVDVIGPPAELKSIKANNLHAQIDLTGNENFTGVTELPAKIIIDSNNKCWVYGTYSVNVKVE
ncbi:MAG: hypothetical protein IJ758_02860 [Clostridia bacterium]|nr:hypothetical protein [Clostridia bacterium]